MISKITMAETSQGVFSSVPLTTSRVGVEELHILGMDIGRTTIVTKCVDSQTEVFRDVSAGAFTTFIYSFNISESPLRARHCSRCWAFNCDPIGKPNVLTETVLSWGEAGLQIHKPKKNIRVINNHCTENAENQNVVM